MKHSRMANFFHAMAIRAVVSTGLFVLPPMVLGAGPQDTPISPEGLAQVAALIQEKESRTPAQRKIDSNILYEIKMRRGQKVAAGVATLVTGLSVDVDGLMAVEIRARVTDALVKKLVALKATIIDLSKAYRTVTARVPLSEIEALAGMGEVVFIQPYFPANFWHDRVTSESDRRVNPSNDLKQPAFEERARRVRALLEDVLPPPSLPQVGSQNSQGDTTHQANTARTTIGPNGSGIKVGVLSNGVVSLAASQALGDLPSDVVVLPGQVGTGDEGTAMLEIVHDLAPQAQLYFATANPTPARFAQNVRDLRAAGCDIIIDDVFYFVETPFQDGQAPSVVSNTNGGLVTQAVKDVVASGALFFSSAGNQGNVDDNTASCYQGDFVNGGTLGLAVGGNVHDFGAGAQSDLIQTGSANPINLYWADPLGGSSNDYDLYVFNNALTAVVASSTNVQNGTQDPFEQVGTGNTTNNRVVILKKTGSADRFFHVTINANGTGRLGVSAPGTTKGHSMAAGAFSVAATPAAAPGPFPSAHSSTNVSETFTSDGPRRIFFNADGTAITPGNFSSTGGELRQKPDITAADRVSVTGVGGFPTTFSGTSAAAPHAGAIAALLKSGLPSPTNAQIRTALTSTAIDIETAGIDRDTGAGIVMPLPALAALGITAQAAIDRGTFAVAELVGSSDGDGTVEKGETGTLVISNLVNNGPVSATSVTATLSSTTAGVTIVPPTHLPYAYADITASGGTASNTTPYQFQLGAGYVCGSSVDFVLTVAYNDGSARSKVFNFTVSLATGFSVPTTLDATAPPASPRYTATTGTQTNRMTRDGQSSICSLPKAAFPGITAATNPLFDAYTFTATNTGCNVVTLAGGTIGAGGSQLFVGVYSGAFVPTSIGTNYLADAGSSPASNGVVSFSFNATAGQTYVVVVSEVPGTPPAPPYTLTVTGPSLTTCDFTSPQADLSITKTDGVTTAVAGGSVTYTITASNSGPAAATGATVADTFPAALTATWTCAGAGGGTCTAAGAGNINDAVSLPSGGSVTYTATAALSAAATGTLANTATVTAPGSVTDPTPGNNSATDTDTVVRQAELAITKTDGVTTATAGGSVTYTIVASNAGPSNTGATVADTFPAALTATWTCVGAGGGTCTAAGAGNINDAVNLPVGASVTYTVTATVSPAANGTLSNTATVSAPGGVTDPTPGNNSATDTDTVDRQADLSITKTDGVTTATAGGSVTYTIVASNAGPSNTTGATVADTLPAALTATWTCVGAGGGTCTAAGAGNINDAVNLPSGGSITYTVSASVSAAATGTLSNTATVVAPGGVTDPTPGNNSATDTDTVARQADLSITKTDGVVAATPGGNVTYTIVAANGGPSNATGATVADAFPAALTATWTCVGAGGGTCTAAGIGNVNDAVNLPVGASVTYTASATINPAATGTLSNTATVSAPLGATDPTPGNNAATDTDTLGTLADLSVTKTDGQSFYHPGQSLTYTIVVTNAGPNPVTGATVVDALPADLTNASWTCVASAGSACGAPSGTGSINALVDLLSGGNATYTLIVTTSPTALSGISNTAIVAVPAGLVDPVPANNTATDTDTRLGGSFHTVSPCRVLDTRHPAVAYGAPPLAASATRTFTIAGQCGVPSNASAVSINLTVTGSTAPGFLLAHPSGGSIPTVSTINYATGQTRANNAVVVLSAGGQLDLTCGQAAGTVDAILDVSGYFVE
jgi:uncharacterized repeat protein (TIGR01451 family)